MVKVMTTDDRMAAPTADLKVASSAAKMALLLEVTLVDLMVDRLGVRLAGKLDDKLADSTVG